MVGVLSNFKWVKIEKSNYKILIKKPECKSKKLEVSYDSFHMITSVFSRVVCGQYSV